ncbi:hypothetical protein GCM10011344_26990 [Dokdonia pacifica]|uniref:Lipoprotein n=1 Tax=Dokdonia pacifica TaxID=1627892 RepID=A0A239E9P3_9FLAO|nr:hypothetical protein [Dokdonia pacifica]GGG24940.1 hypothetical protein GCM10011344_26990 [Dokdonia pacifica]SNS40614.1 hypothetical protein SAMN06265376_11445 [Dokdonia pacifica]
MVIKKLIYIGIVCVTFFSCKENKDSVEKSVESKSVTECDSKSLKEWSLETIKKKEFVLSKENNIKFSDDSTSVTLTWIYDIENPNLDKDEFTMYCIDLIREKITIPENYTLKFNYLLNAYCPVDADLPIEVNSEIQNFNIIDNDSLAIYDFDIVRGRLDSGIKYLVNESKEVTDTIHLKI